MLKKIIAVICAISVLMLCSCDTQWENAKHVEYGCPEGLRMLTADTLDENADVLETIGLTKEGALNALSDGRLFFTSFLPYTTEEGKTEYPTEMYFTVESHDLFENIHDFNRLSEEDKKINLDLMMDTDGAADDGYNVSSVSTVESNGVTFIRFDFSAESNGTTYNFIQYTTVYNGFGYSLFCMTSLEMTEEITAVFNELLATIKFTKTLEAAEEYDPEYARFDHTVSRFFRKNGITVLIVSVVTVALVILLLVYLNYREKHKKNDSKKDDGIVRADYLK